MKPDFIHDAIRAVEEARIAVEEAQAGNGAPDLQRANQRLQLASQRLSAARQQAEQTGRAMPSELERAEAMLRRLYETEQSLRL
ncbi:hypothetical protein M493_07730 [Geobacillus genomosp. 3]|uniref:ATPase n=1 Tax=Geobacillus genomosp. 3 TaxID=1921421 RepID=S5YYS9_GEOG3|nr:hypothetical protein [Geobacillus genomosp. 3]AGT31829.1 hypothetical protein M493_07730 [Geobacillus genomosp. 3]